jgi:hypothetical protein
MPEDTGIEDAPKKVGSKLKTTLTKKVGPLPIWGWALIGGGMVLGIIVLRNRKGGVSTQGGAITTAAPASPIADTGGNPGDVTGPANNPTSVTTSPSQVVTPVTPSIDNRTPAVKLPSPATIVAPTPEEIAYAINQRNSTTGAIQSQWQGVTEEHTQRLAASLNQTPQGRQQLANVTTAYHTNATAAQTFFEQCAKNPAGCNAMFGGK